MTENEIYKEALENGNKLLMAHFRDKRILEDELIRWLNLNTMVCEHRMISEGYMKKAHGGKWVGELTGSVISYWRQFFDGSITEAEWADRCSQVVRPRKEERGA